MTRGYTRNVASWLTRLTSLTTAIALSGSPAVLSACMALCVQHGQATDSQYGTSVGHAAPAPASASAPAPAVASGHSHHASPAAPTPPASAGKVASTPETSEAHVAAMCTNCCGDRAALVAGPAVERADSHATGAAPLVVPVARFFLTSAVVGAAPHGWPVSPPPPSRAPLVLRI